MRRGAIHLLHRMTPLIGADRGREWNVNLGAILDAAPKASRSNTSRYSQTVRGASSKFIADVFQASLGVEFRLFASTSITCEFFNRTRPPFRFSPLQTGLLRATERFCHCAMTHSHAPPRLRELYSVAEGCFRPSTEGSDMAISTEQRKSQVNAGAIRRKTKSDPLIKLIRSHRGLIQSLSQTFGFGVQGTD